MPVGGMRMSVSTTSGRLGRDGRKQLGEVDAHRDQLEPLLRIEQRPRPSRTSRLSSASTTRSAIARHHTVVIRPGQRGRVCDPEGGAGALHRAAVPADARPYGGGEMLTPYRPAARELGPSDDAPGLPGPGRRQPGGQARRPPAGVLLGARVLLLLALACLGALDQVVAESLDHRAYPPPGRTVDLGARRLHRSCQGTGAGVTAGASGAYGGVSPCGHPRRLWWLHHPGPGACDLSAGALRGDAGEGTAA